jgi:hypothetical protein
MPQEQAKADLTSHLRSDSRRFARPVSEHRDVISQMDVQKSGGKPRKKSIPDAIMSTRTPKNSTTVSIWEKCVIMGT